MTDSLRTLVSRGKYSEAEALARSELDRLGAAAGTDSSTVADLLDGIVDAIRRRLGKPPPDAEALAARAVLLRELTAGPEDLRVAVALTNQGRVLRQSRKAEAARDVYERALAIRRKHLPPDDPEIAVSLTSLGLIERDLGHYTEARRMFEGALAIRERRLGPDHEDTGRALVNLGNLLLRQGDFGTAAPMFELAVRIFESRPRVDSVSLGQALENHSSSLLFVGDTDRARPVSRRAAATWERLGPDFIVAMANTYENVGVSLVCNDSALAARPYFDKSREVLSSRLAPDDPILGRNQWNFAKCDDALAQYDSAEVKLLRAREIFEKTQSDNHAYVGGVLSDLARVRTHRGDLAGARNVTEEALALSRARLTPGHVDVAWAIHDVAWTRFVLGDSTGVLDSLLVADRMVESNLRTAASVLSEAQALSYARRQRATRNLMLSTLAEWPMPSRVGHVWDRQVHTRALVLDELAARRQLTSASADTALARWVTQRIEAGRELSTLAFTAQTGPEGQASMVRARERSDLAEMEIARRLGGFRRDRGRATEGWDEVSAALKPTDALVAFVRYDRSRPDRIRAAMEQSRRGGRNVDAAAQASGVSSYGAFVTKGSGTPAFISLGQASAIDSTVRNWRSAMSRMVSGTTQGASRARVLGIGLRRRVWDPVQAHLTGASRVFVVPDGDLQLVSWSALPSERGFLLESGITLHTLTAERDLLVEDTPAETGPGLLAVGDVDYDGRGAADSARAAESDSIHRLGRAAYRGPKSGCTELRAEYGALPFSAAEIRGVASRWRTSTGARALELTGARANEAMVTRTAGDFAVLHLATHGFFVDDECLVSKARTPDGLMVPAWTESPLLRSGLVLAGANRRERSASGEDGFLTAEEIAALDLSGVELVVLSACNSGSGAPVSGEGMLGLRRAFEVAGARAVVASLWEVQDAAARRWMELFYEALLNGKVGVSEATRSASLAMLRQQRARGGANPAVWGAFIATGSRGR